MVESMSEVLTQMELSPLALTPVLKESTEKSSDGTLLEALRKSLKRKELCPLALTPFLEETTEESTEKSIVKLKFQSELFL